MSARTRVQHTTLFPKGSYTITPEVPNPFAGRTDVLPSACERLRSWIYVKQRLQIELFDLATTSLDRDIKAALGWQYWFKQKDLVLLVAHLTSEQSERVDGHLLSKGRSGNLFYAFDYAVTVTYREPTPEWTHGLWEIVEEWDEPPKTREQGVRIFRPASPQR